MSSPGSSRAGSTASAPPIDDNVPSRVYNITNQFFRRHYDINSADNQPLFYGEVSEFTPNKPDLILHAGTSSKGPIVAVSKFAKSSGDYKIGIGNTDDVNAVQWEDMTKELIRKPKYRFEMTVQCESDQTQSGRRSFLWKRTRTIGVEDSAPSKWTGQNYKLVDEHTEQLLAVFSGAAGLERGGKLQIRVEYGEDFDRMALVTCLSLYEKAKRRKHRAGGGGGGGGGG
ncbi:hypothetical protein E8E15_008779 [Penicillium rubens]|jgi:hypothetical protein|uniref:Pc14g01250 protein n=3 Tax=Penicillium chrysogenum species complex TaxID=254878 RepID=B6H5V3_PENRW|nr:uncharacterized protein N7525_000126 [Penicillium rubens]KZN90011.1 hypothetical protein EN45_001180 [Penicillium chrysogenum]CAP74266.1 Pc14g01250 [Penicillium rubens Wisconsin 54-1255]KAF3024601.1 hypothetical protein E8E15_008779 [Penicillium rubens]KAJ5040100.1 hypothetical protein NUH16_009901 [Penicillium rubens]KAJ5842385.1 hypothetical protein N7525_000126 [Penicillium rubens]